MDEPESVAALTLAAREQLDNRTFVINCNPQRLDGPVRGNGRIVDELEALFAGAGRHVVKRLWGSERGCASWHVITTTRSAVRSRRRWMANSKRCVCQ